MNILHICAGWQKWNGAANIARMIMGEQEREGHDVQFTTWASVRQLRSADEVWIHCGWLPCLWWAAVVCYLTQRRRGAGSVIKWMPEACYDPVRLHYHGWKKWLVGSVERFCLRRCSKIIATCEAEKGWIQSYLGKHCPPVDVTDIKRFFDLNHGKKESRNTLNTWNCGELNLLYLGRRHPLKGLEYLEEAVRQLNSIRSSVNSVYSVVNLKVVSNAFGEEKEREWQWCDVLVLPTLSENFGLVVAEALERGKRVITTDGAPAWDGEAKVKVKGEEEGVESMESGEIWSGYGGRLLYLKGYRDGIREVKIRLLVNAIRSLG